MFRPGSARSLLAALPLIVTACAADLPRDDVAVAPQAVRLAGTSRVEAYFTTPTPGSTAAPALETALVALIQSAATSIDVAAYDLDRASIVDALVAAHSQGVAVRFVGDGDQASQAGYAALAAAGVPMALRPAGSAIMHDKFVVVDGRAVVTGSANFSDNDLLTNNNNALAIEDVTLAGAFKAEFDEMFEHGRFGRAKLDVTAGNVVTPSGVTVEYFFGPRDGLMARVLERVDSAQTSIHAMVFTFTRSDLRDRLIARQGAGARVYAIFDQLQASGTYSQDEALAAAGVPTWLDGNTSGLLHHKVMILDGDTPGSDPMVITGSFNWTASGDADNDENLVIVHSAELARAYLRQFCALHAVAARHPSSTVVSDAGCVGRAIVNEALPNPTGTDLGQEYVEIANAGFAPLDLGGFTVRSGGKVRHTFPERFFLPAGGVTVVYDRGAHAATGTVLSTSGTLGLGNAAGSVALHDAAGAVADALAWTATRAGVAKNRSPDVTVGGAVVDHDSVPLVTGTAPRLSPGTHADGMAYEGVGGLVPARAPLAGELVISQLATRGVASASDEFVEIYNPTNALLAIGGTRLQYQPSTCTGWTDRYVVPGGVELRPGQFYLVTGSGYVVPGSGPAGEGALTSGIADAGLLRLSSGATTLDTAAYGAGLACLGEGASAAPGHGTTANGKSVARLPYSAGTPFSPLTPVQDTDVNSVDFAVRAARAPRNGAVITPSR